MARLRHRETGSEVVVPDEKAKTLRSMGYDLVDEKSEKAPAKAAAKQSTK